MKILHTAHSKAQSAKTGEGANSLFNAVGNSKDPKSLVALKSDPKFKNINFDHVLSAAEKGHDPEAMANLLVKEQQEKKNAVLPFAKKNESQAKQKSIIADNSKLQTQSSTVEKSVQKKVPFNATQSMSKQPLQTHLSSSETQLLFANQATNQATQKTEPARKSIFKTNRVLNLQSKSQFAGQQNKVNQNALNATLGKASSHSVGIRDAQVHSASVPGEVQTPLQAAVMNQRAMGQNTLGNVNAMTSMQSRRPQTLKASSSDMVSLQEMRSNKSSNKARLKSNSAYQNNSQSMIKNTEFSGTKNVDAKTVDMLDSQKSVDLGDSTQRFQSQQFNQSLNQTVSANQTGKVLNLNQTQLSGNTETVISQIQDYVVQAQANNQSEVSMSFEHKDLGQVDLMVQKLDPKSEQLNIQIATRGSEAAEFFKTHQGELLNTLNRSGLQVADLKLEAANSSSSQQNLAGDSEQNGQQLGSRGQKQSEQGQRDADQQKRQNLWDQFYENKEAA